MARAQHLILQHAIIAASVVADAGRNLSAGEVAERMAVRGTAQTERLAETTLMRAEQLGFVRRAATGAWAATRQSGSRGSSVAAQLLGIVEELDRVTPRPPELQTIESLHRLLGERIGAIRNAEHRSDS